MCYAIAVCNHTTQRTSLESDLQATMHEASQRVEKLAKFYELQGDNVSIVIYHMKYVVGFHPTGLSSMEPIGSQYFPTQCKG